MNRDNVRQLLTEKGITIEVITEKQLYDLWKILKQKLKESDCFQSSFRMNPPSRTKDMSFLTCKANYFDKREAVSFNSDGFIGFAGWASDKNVQPILEGVTDWANEFIPK